MVERIVKDEKIALKFASSAFLRCLWWGPRQRPFARWFHPQLWLAHLNLSANARGRWIWARTQILNGPIRVEVETTLRTAVVADPITSTSGKPKREILRQIFRFCESFNHRSTRIWGEIYWALWNCWFYCDSGLFLLRRKQFVEWRLASNWWSGLPFHSFTRKSNGFK